MLIKLEKGIRAVVVDVSEVDQLVRRRLLDLGITEGSEIVLKCKMPFGGPFMLECSGQCVGIRRNEARCIKVAEQ